MHLPDVDEGPMLLRRQIVMAMCAIQVGLALAEVLIGVFRRAASLLYMQPFFAGAGILGFLGARNCTAWMVATHFMGSSGLSFVLGLFILAQSFLKRDGTDLMFFAINFPMDLYMLVTSGFSVLLWRELLKFRRELTGTRDQRRFNYEQLNAPDAEERLAHQMQRTAAAQAAERRRLPGDDSAAAGGDIDGASALMKDIRCPVTLEVMRDPVIAGDGHSYERVSIERWLQTHRTSPMTGRVLLNRNLIPNHRLRNLINDIGATLGSGSGRA